MKTCQTHAMPEDINICKLHTLRATETNQIYDVVIVDSHPGCIGSSFKYLSSIVLGNTLPNPALCGTGIGKKTASSIRHPCLDYELVGNPIAAWANSHSVLICTRVCCPTGRCLRLSSRHHGLAYHSSGTT